MIMTEFFKELVMWFMLQKEISESVKKLERTDNGKR